jgi:hypothetical protein
VIQYNIKLLYIKLLIFLGKDPTEIIPLALGVSDEISLIPEVPVPVDHNCSIITLGHQQKRLGFTCDEPVYGR